MKRTAKRPDANKMPKIGDLIWRDVHTEDEPLVLYEMDNPDPIVIRKGERKVLPKQRQFIRNTDLFDFVLYGGAMGGGKSYIGLWNVIYHLIKWYTEDGLVNVRAGIFCETYPTLYDRQISKLAERIPTGLGKWNNDRKEFRLKRKFGGGVIMFRNLDKLDRYKSVEFAMIFVDEITENGNPAVYDVLSTRLRWKGIKHCPFTAACNPGGPGHTWVYDLAIDKTSETYLSPRYVEKYKKWTKGAFFIQCLPQENPYLDDEYYMRLERLPEKLRKAWVDGDWSVFAGQFFSMFETSVHVLRVNKKIPKHYKRFRAIDLGRAHPFVCLWGAVSPSGRLFVYREYSATGHSATYHKQRILELSGDEVYEMTALPHDAGRHVGSSEADKTVVEAFLSDEQDKSKGGFIGNKTIPVVVLDRAGFRQRLDALVDAMDFERDSTYVDQFGQLQLGKITRPPRIQFMPRCKHTIRSIRTVVHDENDSEIFKRTNATRPGQGDDEVSALIALWFISERSDYEAAEETMADTLYSDRDGEYTPEEVAYDSGWSEF